MVIRFTFYNSARAIDGLGEDEAHHLVGEGHPGERNLLVGAVVDGLRETVGAADDEHQPAGRSLFPFQPLGKLHAAEFLSVLIHQHHGVGGLQEFENHFPLPFLLLLLAEALGVLQLGQGGDGERHVVGDALGIVVDARYEMLVDGLADQYEFCLHVLVFLKILLGIAACLGRISAKVTLFSQIRNRKCWKKHLFLIEWME